MRRSLLLAACLSVCLLLAGVGLVLCASREGVVNDVNFRRVKLGMPRERVEQLFGGPGKPTRDDSGEDWFPDLQDGVTAAYWSTQEHIDNYVIAFDAEGIVLEVSLWSQRQPGLWKRLRDRLGW